MMNIFNFFSKRIEPVRALGVLDNEPDYRDISLALIQKPIALPNSYNFAFSLLQELPVFDQRSIGACVVHAIAMLLMFYIFKTTGIKVIITPRMAYKICKIFDGKPSISGTYPRIGALVFCKFGSAIESILANDTTLTEEEYLNFKFTKDILESGAKNKLPGFAFVANDIESIKQAIYQNGVVVGSTPCGDWSKLPVKPTPDRGYHYTLWYGWEKLSNGDYKIFFKNSWGSSWLVKIKNWLFGGYGYFLWSDYNGKVRDIIAFTEIPKNYLDIVKTLPFKFTKDLSLNMSDLEVKELQKLLNVSPDTAIALDDVGSPGQETTYFGLKTRDALKKWQKKNGITPTGYFGPKSIAKANERLGKANRIKDWALAIQSFEGWFAGSRSFRNNNPGNIRYSGMYINMSIGHDDKFFCVFKDYQTGLAALETLLTRACSGLSTVYSPSNTLLEFFSKYAPSSDNNYPDTYAAAVAKFLNVPVSTEIKDLL